MKVHFEGTERYEFAYGHAPRGRGFWMFEGEKEDGTMFEFSFSGMYSDAKRAAMKAAKEENVDSIRVCT